MAAMKHHHSPASTDAQRWARVLAKDAAADGVFVYADRSTGIYCRPSCPSRRPGRDKVRFYPLPALAEAEGFRACKRCRPDRNPAPDRGQAAVGRALSLIAESDDGIPTLDALSRAAGLSPHHLQRLFKGLVGVSPRQYGEALRLARFKQNLKSGDGVTGALYGAGYGSASRLYEKAPAQLGMTPATYAKGGKGAAIGYATAAAPLGRLLVAATGRGVCMVALGTADKELQQALRLEFPEARISRDRDGLAAKLDAVLARVSGQAPAGDLPLDVRATAFQWRVWRALAAIPAGETRSYSEIAAIIGRPRATRAVARACATNPVAVVIPCHRAVGASGALTGYRWGVERKAKLLENEGRPAPKKRRA
jgi:AraC family transcriptional regulator of adaptative response/methylated-DNA-[protein]-cysteine methyltransferase